MPVHAEVQAFLQMLAAANLPPYEHSTVAQARERMNAIAMLERPASPLAEVRDQCIPAPHGDIPLRLYRSSLDQSLPTLIYFHGGGWVVGSIESHDRLCRALASASGFAVISVEYRLAPEHKYPAAVEDAEAAYRYVRAFADKLGVDSESIFLGGDSAGGNLSAVVSQRARDAGEPLPRGQVLIYPATGSAAVTESRKEFADGYLLTAGAMMWFTAHYISDLAQLRESSLSPCFAKDVSGLPPTFLLTAEFDPLRDEGEDYAAKLTKAGVNVTLRRYDGMIHGFLQLSAMVSAATTAIEDIATWLKQTQRGT